MWADVPCPGSTGSGNIVARGGAHIRRLTGLWGQAMTKVGGAEVLGADPITERQRLAGRIDDHLRWHRHHLTHMDSHDDQARIDLQAATLMAGRWIEQGTVTYTSAWGK